MVITPFSSPWVALTLRFIPSLWYKEVVSNDYSSLPGYFQVYMSLWSKLVLVLHTWIHSPHWPQQRSPTVILHTHTMLPNHTILHLHILSTATVSSGDVLTTSCSAVHHVRMKFCWTSILWISQVLLISTSVICNNSLLPLRDIKASWVSWSKVVWSILYIPWQPVLIR